MSSYESYSREMQREKFRLSIWAVWCVIGLFLCFYGGITYQPFSESKWFLCIYLPGCLVSSIIIASIPTFRPIVFKRYYQPSMDIFVKVFLFFSLGILPAGIGTILNGWFDQSLTRFQEMDVIAFTTSTKRRSSERIYFAEIAAPWSGTKKLVLGSVEFDKLDKLKPTLSLRVRDGYFGVEWIEKYGPLAK